MGRSLEREPIMELAVVHQRRRVVAPRGVLAALVAFTLVAATFGVTVAEAEAGPDDGGAVADPGFVISEMQDLGGLTDGPGEARGVNDSGVIVGRSQTTTWRPFRYDPDTGEMTDVGPSPVTVTATATDVNTAGVIVGTRGLWEGEGGFVHDPTSGTTSALALDAASSISDTGLVAGFVVEWEDPYGEVSIAAGQHLDDSSATGIAGWGSQARAVASTEDGSSAYWALNILTEGSCPSTCFFSRGYRRTGLLTGGSLTGIAIPTVGPWWDPVPLYTDATAMGVNAGGDVVGGFSHIFTGERTAYLHEPGSSAAVLFASGGLAYDVNDHQLVVGQRGNVGSRQAFAWHPTWDGPVDLGTLGGAESAALAVNNHGLVVGWSHDETGQQRPFSVQVDFPSLPSLPSLSGTVLDADGAPVPDAVVGAFGPDDVWVASFSTVADDTGFWSMELSEPADLDLLVRPPPGTGLRYQWYGGGTKRSAASTVSVDYDETLAELGVVLPSGGGLSGTVVDVDGVPIAGAQVMTFGPTAGWVGEAVAITDATGAFAMEGLEGAVHRVRVVPPPSLGLGATWYDEAPSRSEANGVSVVVDQTTSITVSVP